MPVPLALLVGCAVGAGIALAAREPLSHAFDPLRTRYFLALLILLGAVLVPSVVLPYLLFPDWTLMYLADPARLPTLLVIPLLAGLIAVATTGSFLGAHRALRSQKAKAIRGFLVVLAALALILMLTGRHRLLEVAYYDGFHHGGSRVPLLGSPLFLTLALIVPAVLGACVFTSISVRHHAERPNRAAVSPPPAV